MNSYQQHGQEMMGCAMVFLVGIVPLLFALIAALFMPWFIPAAFLIAYYWIFYKVRNKKSKK